MEVQQDAKPEAVEAPRMSPFVDSSDLVGNPEALRTRFAEDGYVFLKGVVDRDMLRDVRARIVAACAAAGWLTPGTDPMDAVPCVIPAVEGEKRYFEVYDEVQKLEAFHAVPHHPTVRSYMTDLLGDSAFPHPLSIARLSFPSNEEWTTPPHQDYPNNQGTEDLYATWIPLSDCPVELGGLAILPGSHRLGLVPLEFALGPGNRKAKFDERLEALEWVGGDLELGDALVFHSLTVHRALPNRTDRMRLSVDYRFQREDEPLTAGCLEPHFARLSWEEIYREWTREELKHYWRDKRYTVVPWDSTLHEISEKETQEGVTRYLMWLRARNERAGISPDPLRQKLGLRRLPSASDALAAAQELVDEGNTLAAVDGLQRLNRDAHDSEVERRLVQLRCDAFAELDRSAPSGSWPPPVPSVPAEVDGLPTVSPERLTLDALRSGIFGHGCLFVPGLVPVPQVDRLVEGIDRAFKGYEAHANGAPAAETTPWFEPFSPGPGYSVGLKRKWGWEAGGVFLADSPRVMHDLVEALADAGLGRLIAEHLGQRPALSMYKSILRRVPSALEEADWHQDGAFLGTGMRVVNVWLCLSHCGRDAPGLDVVARRFDGLVESGTGGAHFKWSVGPKMVEQRYGESCVRPMFEPGDVLLFDELFLHRTATTPEMTKERYAIETWFFAPSTYPDDKAQVGIPLVF